ncbi:MAG: SigB/SigF/SigG family RNA polymerase sigma factor [Clostridia bacterium]|nr:SigB/SigF/SigG family RNA polymerase sigma factor [Clostridia bacterium]
MNSKVFICGVDTSSLPRLNDEQTTQLIKSTKEGDDYARSQLVVANMRLVLSIIKRFWAKKANQDDVFQAGCIGLIKAIDNFDLKFGVKFSTYAVPMIIGEIKRFLRDGNSLRIPRSIRDTAYKALQTRSELEKQSIEPTMEMVAERMQVAVTDVCFALDAISDTVSLYEPVFTGKDDTLMLMDQLGDQKNTDENWTEYVALDTALSGLDQREKQIIYSRYYEGKTQTEISEEIGISQAQVSRLEKTALKELKHAIRI